MIPITPWSTIVRPPDAVRSTLTLLIRLALPVFNRDALIGPDSWSKHTAAPPLNYSAAGIDLQTLSWRPIDTGASAKRRVTHWTFKGEAVQNSRYIHFYGEYLRDEATGALREVLLHTKT